MRCQGAFCKHMLSNALRPIYLLLNFILTAIHGQSGSTKTGTYMNHRDRLMRNLNPAYMAAILLCMTTSGAVASEAENGFRMNWFAGFGLTFGGDELAEVEVYNDYFEESYDEDIRAGELATLTAGIVVYFPTPSWSLQGSIGYHVDDVSTDDEIRFDRYPLELIPFYNFGNHRLGAGISHHFSPELELEDFLGPDVEFDDATGWLVEYDYSFPGWEEGGFVLGIRYLWIDYEADRINGLPAAGSDVDGNHVGIHVNYQF